jgi:spermidine synthase
VSGAAGLVYEIVWSRVLSTTLGNSLFAISTVVAAFFGGLALGACTLGPRLADRADRVRLYALLEIGVGLLGALSVPFLRAIEPLFVALHRALLPSFPVFLSIRFLVLFVVLLVPTALMGATLPLLVAHAEGRRFGSALSRLYAINTLGAVTGTLLAAFALVPILGLTGSALAAAAANGLAAALAWSRRAETAAAPAGDAPGAETRGEPAAPQSPHRRGMIAALVAASGFAALVFEVTWTRILTLVIGSSVISFAIVLAFYLLGIAWGSALIARRLPRLERPLLLFGLLQVSLAVVTLTHLFLFPALPGAFLRIILEPSVTLPLYLGAQALAAAILLVPPCLFLGALFPLAARLPHRRDAGRATGAAYAVNTAGTILGSLAAGFVLIPRIGSRSTLLAGALLSLAIGFAALAASRAPRARRAGVAGAALAAALVLVALAPAWDPRVLTAGVFRPAAAQVLQRTAAAADPARARLESAVASDSILFFEEGVNATVSVHRRGPTGEVVLKLGGKADASTIDIETQILCGHIPMFFNRLDARVAVIGHGSGMTLASVLMHAPREVVAIELETAVLEASRFFHAPGKDPLDDPRVRVVVEDGRTHLAVTRDRYDVIISEPSNPWLAGNNNLFTRDFYRLVRSRLAPGGVFGQWLQLYELSPETLASLLAAFHEVFPSAYAFVTFQADLILVATDGDARWRLGRLKRADIAAEFRRVSLDTPEEVLSYYACSVAEMPARLAAGRVNTDDDPRVEYRAPIDLFEVGRREITGAGGIPLADQIPRSRRVPFADEVDDRTISRWRAAGLVRQGRLEAARAAAEWVREAGDGAAADSLDALITTAEEDARARAVGVEVARLGGARRFDEAERIVRDELARAPGDPVLVFHLGLVLMQTGQDAEADSLFARTLATARGTLLAKANVNRGILAMRRNAIDDGLAFFREAQALSPDSPDAYAYEARVLAEAGRAVEARAALERGLAACPGDARLLEQRAALAGGL